MGYADRLTGHGIRTTISTTLNELGYPTEWIEIQLSHVDPNQVRAAYNHAAYVEQRRTMMQDWADRLDAWADGQDETSTAMTQPSHAEKFLSPHATPVASQRVTMAAHGQVDGAAFVRRAGT